MTRRHWLGHLASTALGVPAVQFFSSPGGQRPEPAQVQPQHHRAVDGRRPQPSRHLGPQARQREERRPVQADRDLGPRREDHRASAQGRQADAPPVDHPLARLEGREPRSRHLHDAHRLRPQPDGDAPRLRLGTARSSWARSCRTSTCRTASRSTRPGRGPASSGMSYAAVRGAEPERPDRQPQAAQGGRRLAAGAAAAHARPGRDPVRQPAEGPGGRRSQGRLRQDAADDELALPGRLQPRAGAGRGARRLRPRIVRLGLPDGPPAGGAGGDLRRGGPRRLGHARRTTSTPSRAGSCPSWTRGWAP